MRRKLIAGNWKMNGLLADGTALADAIIAGAPGQAGAADLLVCPPFTLLQAVGARLSDSAVALGAQDCHPAASGAHTGDVAAPMLADLGCTHVIVGHSERRHDHGETSALVARKAQAAQQAGLTAIVCLGETQAERDAGRTLDVLSEQLTGSLADVDPARLVLAYEPVWAIGTGRTATADDVETAHAHLRAELTGRLGNSVGGPVRLLYGGSVKPANAGELLAVPDVDGALVGGASLKSADFLGIAAAATPMS